MLALKGNEFLPCKAFCVYLEGDLHLAVFKKRLERFAGDSDRRSVLDERISGVFDHQFAGEDIPLGRIQGFVGDGIDQNSLLAFDNGLVAVKGMEKLLKSPCHKSSSAADEFANGAAIVVTGTWAYDDISKILGDNMGATDLPSFEVDGKEYHLGSFNGCKLMGVKPQADAVKGAALHKLAQYLTGEACQMERFNALSWGPANLVDQAAPEVQANPGLSALLLQGAYSRPQGQIHGSWWNIANVIGDEVKAASSEDDLKAALQNYYNKINDLFKLDASALLFVGAWNGWNNADDADTYYLTDNGDGTFSLTLDVPASDYMGGRIVSPGDWGADKGFAQVTDGADLLNADAAGGDNNIVFNEAIVKN